MPTIGNDVWIGVNATIVGKVTIGDNVLISPNAFVNCDIHSHSVVFVNSCIIKHRRQAEHTCTDFYVPYETDYKKALRGNPLSCLTTMYDREAIGDVFFDETYDRHEDYILWLSILKRGIVA